MARDEQADDLVGVVFFLASPDADFISGQTIHVDGGKHNQARRQARSAVVRICTDGESRLIF
jgi:NAD(P)-dependent dehydrogenase (short-subunit alcohol dehydrogenase family)